MIKTVLVPTSGSPADEAVFATARVLAAALAAHLEFLHLRLSPVEAAVRTPHLDYCLGSNLPQALERARRDEAARAEQARAHFSRFCGEYEILVRDAPVQLESCSAAWIEESDFSAERLMMRARHSDLVVLGRPHHADYMPNMLLDDLLMGCGRPIVISPARFARTSIDTVLIGWSETPETARALSAAMPLLERARKVVILHITTDPAAPAAALEHLARQLEWHGITAVPKLIHNGCTDIAVELAQAAAEHGADLLVVGAFGHGRLRERVFGGVTQSLLEHAELPVFILH